MVEFKLVISDPKSGKTVQKEVKEQAADAFMSKRIGESMTGESIDLTGYEFMITGGSDKSGFPMRKGIQTPRKKVVAGAGSVGFRGKNRKKTSSNIIKKKTVCGERIDENISQINLKISKQGAASLFEEAKPEGEATEEKAAEAPKEEKKEEQKTEEKKPEGKAAEKEIKEEPKKEEKAEEKPKEETKKEEKEDKPAEKKEESPKEEKKE